MLAAIPLLYAPSPMAIHRIDEDPPAFLGLNSDNSCSIEILNSLVEKLKVINFQKYKR